MCSAPNFQKCAKSVPLDNNHLNFVNKIKINIIQLNQAF